MQGYFILTDAVYVVIQNHNALITFKGKYPDVLSENNLDDILSRLMERQENVTRDDNEEQGPVMSM